MKTSQRRQDITKYIDVIENSIKSLGDDTETIGKFTQLKKDINNDFFTVLVVGEFKRGKSTFVNALLGEDLMITNVVPETATIQAVMYGEEKLAEAIFEDGHKERGNANKEFLSKFSANSSLRDDNVKYIKLSYPCEILKNNVVLVDTPGVADLDEQRVQVTYDFLPKANAVIMVLDATSPMSKSEKEFIEEHLITNGISKVIFLLNRIDVIDEDEVDIDEYLDITKKRIKEAFCDYKEMENPVIIPVSAYKALAGISNGDEQLIEESNIRQVKQMLQESLFGGEMETIKLNTYKYRLEKLLNQYLSDFENDRQLLQCDSNQLIVSMNQVNELKEYFVASADKIDDYVENENQTLLAMLDKSLERFREELIDDVMYEIDRYQGSEFKSFVERDIPHLIKKKTDMWLMSKGHSVDVFYGQLERKLSIGLSQLFRERVYVDSTIGDDVRVYTDVQLSAKDVSGATIEAGAITAIGVIAMTAFGFGAFAPLVGYAVLPALRNGFLKNELKSSKEQIIPLVYEEIDNHVRNMRNTMEDHIYKRTDGIVNSVKMNYNGFLNNYQNHIKRCIDYKEKEDQSIADRIAKIDNNCTIVKKVLTSIRSI